MYVQTFIKGIQGSLDFKKEEAFDLVASGRGLISNWWRSQGVISPPQVAGVLTERNLDRHLHDYGKFGSASPFISLAAGCVSRDSLLHANTLYRALQTALDFATDCGRVEGALFYGWTIVGTEKAVAVAEVSEAVRELHVYRRWSPYQLEGEVTAKIAIPSNHIQRVEWWRPNRNSWDHEYVNPDYVAPDSLLNIRWAF